MPNTAVDIILILIILLSAILAFVRGFMREALALGTWLAAVYLGFTQYPHVTPYLEDKISNPMIRDFAGGIVIFFAVLLILVPIGFYLRSFIKGEQITAVDRSLGFLFGAARGFLLISILYLIVSWLLPEEKQPLWLKEANTKPVMVFGADLVKSLIPAEQRELMEKKKDDIPEGESVDQLPENTGTGAHDAIDNVINNIKGGK